MTNHRNPKLASKPGIVTSRRRKNRLIAGENGKNARRDPLNTPQEQRVSGRSEIENGKASVRQVSDPCPPASLKTFREPGRDPSHLMVERASKTETAEETEARMVMAPAVSSSFLVRAFGGKGVSGERPIDATMAHDVVVQKMAAISAGDLTGVEGMMMARACALEAAATEYMRRAALCISNPQATETYMRIALRAESQLRSYLEAIAEAKNPRPVFARNINLANGNQQVNNSEGPQQVNNGPPVPRAEVSAIGPNKLLEQ